MSKRPCELFDEGVLLTFWNESIRYRDPIIDQSVGRFRGGLYIVDENGNPCTKAYDGFYLQNGTLMGYIDGATTERVVVDYEVANRTIHNLWRHEKM